MYDTPEFAALKKFVNLAFDKYTYIQLSARKKADRKATEKVKAVLTDAQKSVKVFSKRVDSFQRSLVDINKAESLDQKAKIISSMGNQLTNLLGAAEVSLSNVRSAYSYYKLQDDF